MGSRLGVIVRSDAGWEIYYDHRAAQTIGHDIALDGFEATLKRVRTMRPVPVDHPRDWSGTAWLEGGLLIDLPSKTVVWAAEGEGSYLPRLINALLENTWPGWTAIWSSEATPGVLRVAGVEPDPSPTGATHETHDFDETSWLAPWSPFHPTDAFSAALDNGDHVVWQGSAELDKVAEAGPYAVHQLATTVRERVRASEPWTGDEQAHDSRPEAGIHIDFTTHTLRWWSIYEEPPELAGFDVAWADWTISSMGDNFEWHEGLIGHKLRDWTEDVRQCRKWMQRVIDEGEHPNPLGTVEHLSDVDMDVDANAPEPQFIPARRKYGAVVLELLDRLAKQPALPPARFIDRDGHVHPPVR